MKFLVTLLIALFVQSIQAQSEANNILCDSIIMTDGSVKVVQIKEVKRNKIIYIKCCEPCTAEREFKLQNIRTILYNEKKVEESNILDSNTITLQHTEKLKKVLFKEGDQIKLKQGEFKVKGKIVSISNGYMSIDPNKKRLAIIDSIDVNQLKWIKKYNDRKGLRPFGAFVQVIGTIGTSFFILGTAAAVSGSADELIIAGVGGLIGSAGIHLGGYYMQGARRYIGKNWSWIE